MRYKTLDLLKGLELMPKYIAGIIVFYDKRIVSKAALSIFWASSNYFKITVLFYRYNNEPRIPYDFD